MRVLVFGDSITQGFWDTEGGWVDRFKREYIRQTLAGDNKNDISIFNLGISGGTSKTISDRFDNEAKARHGREQIAFVFSTGVNDSCREGLQNYKSTPEDYGNNLQQLVTKARVFSEKILFVGLVAGDERQTMPVAWRDIYYFNDRIKTFEDVMKDIAAKNNAAFVPVFDEFKKHLDKGENLLADGLHPNNDGHQLIFELVQPELEKLLKN